MKLVVLILISVFFFWTSIEAGQIYEWIDQNGVKHFSDQPPPGATIVNEVREIEIQQPETPAPEITPADPSDARDAEDNGTGNPIVPPRAGDSVGGGEEAVEGDSYENARIGDPGEQAGIGDPGEEANIGDPGEEATIGDPGEEADMGDPGEKEGIGDPGEEKNFD